MYGPCDEFNIEYSRKFLMTILVFPVHRDYDAERKIAEKKIRKRL